MQIARFGYGKSEPRDREKITTDQRIQRMVHKKIAYLVSEYPAISHTFVFREIQALRNLGLDIRTASILIPRYLDQMTEKEQADAKETLCIKDSPLFRVIQAHFGLCVRSLGRYLFMLKEALELCRRGPRTLLKGLFYFGEAGILVYWMMKQSITHVHVHFANPAANVAMIGACYGTISYSISVHGPSIFSNVEANLLAEKVTRATFVRCVSYYCQAQLMRLVPYEEWSKLHIVRCGIDPQTFQPRPEPNNDILEVLCVGRLVPDKGQHFLLQACGILQEQGRRFHLTFVGDGEDRASLEELAQRVGLADAVTFAGAVGQDRIHAYYNRADIFVLPSFAEGIPVVLMEAMAKEIACISTRITGIPELIDDGQDGILIAPADIDGLVMALCILSDNPVLRRELAQKGRSKVMSCYDIFQNSQKMSDIFWQ